MAINNKTLNVDININSEQSVKEINEITQAFQTLQTQLNQVNSVFSKFNGSNGTTSLGKEVQNVAQNTKLLKDGNVQIKKTYSELTTNGKKTYTTINGELKSVNETINKNTNASNSWYESLTKIGLTAVALRRIGTAIGNVVQVSGDWIETLNLFEVTFGDVAEETLDWSVDFATNLGFAVGEITKFTALFKQLSTSIALADETGDSLAQTLTMIGTDITSLYNLSDITTAMEKIQSGIFTGQTKPLTFSGTIGRPLVKKLCEPRNLGCEQYLIAC